jgi:hypothetical protein
MRWRRLRQQTVVGWRRPAAVESAAASLLGCYGSGTAMRKGRADAAEELGDKDGGVALRFGAVDPLHRCGARARGAGRSERRWRNKARGRERVMLAELCERTFCLCGWFDASDGNRASKRPKQSITLSVLATHTDTVVNSRLIFWSKEFLSGWETTEGIGWMRIYSSQSTCVEVDWSEIKLNSIPFHSNICRSRWTHMHPNKPEYR